MSRLRLLLLCLLAPTFSSAAITGTVMTYDGQPIPGARVAVRGWESPEARQARLLSTAPDPVPLAVAQTDAKGTFSIPSPKEGAPFFLDVFARGYEPQRLAVEREDEIGGIPMSRAETRRGRVTAGGKPVANAVVSIRYGAYEHTVRTDEKGSYEAPDITRARSIAALHPDFAIDAELFFSYGRTPSSELNRTLTAGSPRAGRVADIDGRTPAANAVVWVDGWPLATTADDGTFSIARMPAKWTAITARKSDRIGERSFAAAGDLALRLSKAGAISGRVTDEKTRVPIAGAVVTASVRRQAAPEFRSDSIVTDAKGNWVLHLTPGAYVVGVTHPSYGGDFAESSASPGQPATRDFALPPLARVSGSVVDEAKQAVAAASLVPEDQGRGGPGPGMRRMRSETRPAFTTPDGRFLLRVPAGEMRLRASRKGLPPATSEPLTLAQGERKNGVVITMASGIEVTGYVSDAEGNPLSGVTVAVAEEDPDRRRGRRMIALGGASRSDDDLVKTDSEGEFVLHLKEGVWDFTFRREGYASGHVRAKKIAADGENDIEIELEPAVEISGRVTRGGSPVEGVTLMAFAEDADANATTGPDGSFALTGLPRGPVGVAVRKAEDLIQDQRTFTAPARDVAIEIPEGVTVSGRVVEKGSKRPVPVFQAGMSVSRSAGGMVIAAPPLMRSFASEDGSFVLEHVPTGAINLVATAPGYAEGKVNLHVEEGKDVEGVEVPLEPGVRLTGKVTTSTGAPVAGASVSLESNGMQAGPMFDANRTTTDAEGSYSFDSLEPGEKTVVVAHAKHASARRTATLKSGETRLDIQLDAGTRITGTVVTESGAPAADADVSASGGGAGRSARTGPDGSFEMDGLPAGRYRFRAEKTGFADGQVDDFDTSTGAPVRIVLNAGGTIYGHVSGVGARDLAQTQVEAVGTGGRQSVAVDPSGDYKLEGVPAGTVHVSARVFSRGLGGTRSTAAQTVQMTLGGSQQVDLEFRNDVAIGGAVLRNGTPLAGAMVQFTPKTASAQTTASAMTDESGRYEVTGLESGEYSVGVIDVQRLSPHYTTCTVSGSATFDIEFDAVGVRGRVLDSSTGEPLSDVNVQLRPASQGDSIRAGRAALTDATGTFTLDLVPPGTYLATATKEGYGTGFREVAVGQAAVESLEIKLARNDDVRLKIVDGRDGRVLRGTATVFDLQGRVVVDSRALTGSSSADELELPLAPGAYTASVWSAGYASRTIALTSPSRQTVTLTPGGTLVLTSKHDTRRRLQLIDGSGRRYLYYAARAGRPDLNPQPSVTTLQNVAAGEYTVQLLSEDETTVAATIRVVVPEGGVVGGEI